MPREVGWDETQQTFRSPIADELETQFLASLRACLACVDELVAELNEYVCTIFGNASTLSNRHPLE